MGHLFRTLNLSDTLKKAGIEHIFFVNAHQPSLDILDRHGVSFERVDLSDMESDWESRLINKYGVNVWVNDRLDTDLVHARNVKKNDIVLVTFDDRGSGAELADIHFAALVFEGREQLRGEKLFTGPEYLILNPEINEFRRERESVRKILVTLGGSDTYGVTLKVTRALASSGRKAVVLTGPAFEHQNDLDNIAGEHGATLELVKTVPSLMRFFSDFDLAVTGGGITPFEANASGLPCVIVANETFEIPVAEFLHKLGSSVFSSYHTDFSDSKFFSCLNEAAGKIHDMSLKGMQNFDTCGAERILEKIRDVAGI